MRFRSSAQSINSTTTTASLVLHLFGAVGEFKCDLLRERTTAGPEAAPARGRRGGRPAVMTLAKLAAAGALIADGEDSVAKVAAAVGVSRQLAQAASTADSDSAEVRATIGTSALHACLRSPVVRA